MPTRRVHVTLPHATSRTTRIFLYYFHSFSCHCTFLLLYAQRTQRVKDPFNQWRRSRHLGHGPAVSFIAPAFIYLYDFRCTFIIRTLVPRIYSGGKNTRQFFARHSHQNSHPCLLSGLYARVCLILSHCSSLCRLCSVYGASLVGPRVRGNRSHRNVFGIV